MSHDMTNQHLVAGAVIGGLSIAVPDGIMPMLGRILIGVITGFLSGMAYKLGARLVGKGKS